MNGFNGIPLPAATEDDGDIDGTPPPAPPEVAPSTDAKVQNSSSIATGGLGAHRNAREIIRLIQCSLCSFPIRYPIALPCGNTICRECLPGTYIRQGITFPNMLERREGFMCTFADCHKEHSMADCGVDVTLAKVLDIFDQQLGHSEFDTERPRTHLGRLRNIYDLVRTGRLTYDGDLRYSDEASTAELDDEDLNAVVKMVTHEVECQVCYGLLLDPVTTHCGHTFCRRCLQRVLDHSNRCPSCRDTLQLPSLLPATLTNKLLTAILFGLLPDALAKRAATVAVEEMGGSEEDNGLNTPLFVCACSFPEMPTPLFIFEPRYRLMMRRVMEGNRQFGMVLPNKYAELQGQLGQSPFMRYGTMLYIEQIETYEDGRSHVWTVGVSKFIVKDWALRDDYVVAKVDRMEDIPIAEEEAVEAMETTQLAISSDMSPSWTRISTQSLLRICHEFVDRMQDISEPWIHENNMLTFGPRPDDPAVFPYWLASVLPIADLEKYRLIKSRSVRERLLITVSWVKRIENHRWYSSPSCLSL